MNGSHGHIPLIALETRRRLNEINKLQAEVGKRVEFFALTTTFHTPIRCSCWRNLDFSTSDIKHTDNGEYSAIQLRKLLDLPSQTDSVQFIMQLVFSALAVNRLEYCYTILETNLSQYSLGWYATVKAACNSVWCPLTKI